VGRRGAIVLVVILVTCLAVLGFFLRQNNKTVFADPYKAIPTDACIIVESVDFKGLIKTISGKEGLFGEISKIKEFESINYNLQYLDSLLGNKDISKLFIETTTLVSLHIEGNGSLVPLLVTIVPSETKLRHIREILTATPVKSIIEKNFNGTPFLEIPYSLKNKNKAIYISSFSGILICSQSEELIRKSIMQAGESSDIRSTPGFSKIMSASGKNEDKLFLVFNNLGKILEPVLKEGSANLAGTLSLFASCAEGDIYLNGSGIILNGYTESSDSTQFLFNYKNITPSPFNTYKVLPAATVLFETLLLPEKPLTKGNGSGIDAITASFAASISPYIGDEVTMAYVDIKERPVNENALIIYELRDVNSVEMILNQELRTYYEENNIKEEDYIFYFEPDDQTKTPVYRTPFSYFSNAIIPGFVNNADNNYFSFIDNYLVTGNSFVTISRLLYDNLLKKTLANDLTYRNFEGTLPSRAGYMFYCVPSGIIDYLSLFLKEDIIGKINNNINSLKKVQSAGYQFAYSNDMMYNSLSVQYKDEIREETGTEWESLLEAPACIKPFFFTNHNTGAKEIFVQDINNNIYLLNSAGRILWKTLLNERITGSVYMIDYYKNGKYQLLFAGKNYLHLLDRNGNYVERYPVKLRSPSTNSLALFDYENNRDYRLFIAGEDKLIYAYDKSGNVVKGWAQFKTAGPVKKEIRFFRISGKDYIVVTDETSVYFLDRSGHTRIYSKENVRRARKSELRLTSGSNPSLLFSSPDGTINFIYFNGDVEKQNLGTFTENHSFDFFDADGDGFGEYVFIDEGKLYLYDHDRKEIFIKDFSTSDLGGPLEFTFSTSEKGIGVFDNNNKLIYLVNKDGDIFDGFPLKGASLFSITKLSDREGFNLIVGGSDGGFLYNYKILNGSK
jgi:hypothetical protein